MKLFQLFLALVSALFSVACSAAERLGTSMGLDARHVTDSVVQVRDRAGTTYPLLQTLREDWRFGGGTTISRDGERIAFSIPATPDPDVSHSAARTGFTEDGTPDFRRGNRLMVARLNVAGPSPNLAGAPVLVSPAESWNPSWSPDSQRLAYFSNEAGKVQLWMYDLATEKRRRVADCQINVHLLSTGDLPVWDADGKRLFVSVATSFVHDGALPRINPYFVPGDVSDARSASIRGGNPDIATSAVAAIDVESGAYTLLPSNGPINRLHGLALSPTGLWLATLTDDYQLSVISLPDLKLHSIGPMDALPYRADDYAAPYWSPAGDVLTYLSGGRVFSVDLTNGISNPKEIGGNLGTLPWHYENSQTYYGDNLNPPAYTSDGQFLIGLILREDVLQLVVMPLNGSHARLFPMRGGHRFAWPPDLSSQSVTARDIDLLRVRPNVLWQPHKGRIYLSYTDYDTAEVVIDDVDITTGVTRTVKRWNAHFQLVGERNDREAIAFYEDLATPGNLFRVSAALERATKPIVDLAVRPETLNSLRKASISTLTTVIPTRSGSLKNVTTSIIRPGSARGPVPAIVYVYPGYQGFWAVNRFPDGASEIPIAELLSRGYAVVLPHVLGLAPYQPTIEQVETDGVIDSVMPQLYHAGFRGLIDVRRLAIMGTSQGGHAAVAAVTRTHLFRAAISINGVRFSPTETTVWFPADAQKNVDVGRFVAGLHRLLDNAPYLAADKILTPVLLIHGSADPTSSSSTLMVDALNGADKSVEFAPYPGLGHNYMLWPRDVRLDLEQRICAFLDAHVR